MKTAMTLFLVLLFIGCKGQEKEKPEEKGNEKKDLSENPKKQWKVQIS